MPLKTKELQREYQRKWIAARRAKWLAENGPCRACGSLERLEVDHVDPATKVHHAVWSWSEVRRLAELAKCQVLCRVCHAEKTAAWSRTSPDHGTDAKHKRGCRCQPCRDAHAAASRVFRARGAQAEGRQYVRRPWNSAASGMRGVHQTKSGKWMARLGVAKKRLCLGSFPTKELALAAYAEATRRLGK